MKKMLLFFVLFLFSIYLFGQNNFLLINGSSFIMGSPASEQQYSAFQRLVTVSSLIVCIYPVTQKEFEEIMSFNPSEFKGTNLPVENVSWYDAIEYCNRRSIIEGLTPVYVINKNQKDPNNRLVIDPYCWIVIWNRNANGYRLPTEAEWEYLCRAGTTTPFYTGDNVTTDQANYDGNWPYNNNLNGIFRGHTVTIGSFEPNQWGLYDMIGNTWEWCWNWFDYPPVRDVSLQIDPTGVSFGATRVIRGGAWDSFGENLRSGARSGGYPGLPNNNYSGIGFRIVRNAIR